MTKVRFIENTTLPLVGADGTWHPAWRPDPPTGSGADPWSHYRAGEVAGFQDPAKAAALVAAGVAMYA